jgi:hypothetical protein
MKSISELNELEDNINIVNEIIDINSNNPIKKPKKNEISQIKYDINNNKKELNKMEKIIKEMNIKSKKINLVVNTIHEEIKTLYINNYQFILPELDNYQSEDGVNINSKIIYKKEDFDLINNQLKLIFNNNIKYNLIFRASEDGAFGKIFKKKCKKRKTLIIILSTKNKKFGGYTGQLWDDSNNIFKDNDAFCFSCNNNKIYESIKNNYAIYCKENCGPIFYDMFSLTNNFIKDGGYTYTAELAKLKYNNIDEDYELSGEQIFHIKELEVFEIDY